MRVTRIGKIINEYIRGTGQAERFGGKVRVSKVPWFRHVQRRALDILDGGRPQRRRRACRKVV